MKLLNYLIFSSSFHSTEVPTNAIESLKMVVLQICDGKQQGSSRGAGQSQNLLFGCQKCQKNPRKKQNKKNIQNLQNRQQFQQLQKLQKLQKFQKFHFFLKFRRKNKIY